MKRFIIALIALSLILSLISCSGKDAAKKGDESLQTNDDAPECTHIFSESIEAPALSLCDGVKRFTCSLCGENYTEAIPMTKTLKVLAIGNSFSDDAMEYLWSICNDGGVETIILGNLYVGGCTLKQHYGFIQNDSESYTYRKNTSGEWISTEKTKISTAFEDEAWDIITVQQASGSSGQATTYSTLENILSEVTAKNPNARIYWHITWAYQKDSTHSDFPTYNCDQMKMYRAIISSLKSKVLTNETIKGVIPSGTAIQNLRSSYVGDTVTRDGYHLSYDYGRYTAALTWYAYLTGGDVDAVTWIPENYKDVIELDVIKESVKNALTEPYTVTESKIKK